MAMTMPMLAEDPRTRTEKSAVNSYTEWQPLEEVVVGRLTGGVFPTWQRSMRDTIPPNAWHVFQERGGSPLPSDQVLAAEAELEGLVAALESEGVTVTRPEPVNQSASFATPNWTSDGGLYAAMPRDLLTVIGDTIIEAPMSWRCRYFEHEAYRPLVKSYFRGGGKWLQAPRPQLTDELYTWDVPAGPFLNGNGHNGNGNGHHRWAVTEFEPVFDAADFMRFGHDIVGQRSHVTNDFGIEWLRRALGDEFRVHSIEVNDPHAMHIDATIAPLAPGKLLVHPERYVPNELFRDWEILEAPAPTLPADWPMYFCSPWVSMNVLSVDEHTVVVERHEEPLIEALTAWGFRCIPLDFRHVYSFGGSFHCVTLDVRRRGGIGRYLAV